MAAWQSWELGRAVLAFTALLYAGLWLQVTLMHWAGGFRHAAMWGPVLLTPVMAGFCAAAVVTREGPVGAAVAVVLALGTVLGLVGTAIHLQGLRSQVGGLTLRNLMSGPPPILPVAYAMTGVLGLGALMWNA